MRRGSVSGFVTRLPKLSPRSHGHAHPARRSVESGPGRTVFTLELPAAVGRAGETRAVEIARRHELAQRFLFISGESANARARGFLRETQVPVLPKPFTPQALLRAVEQVSA